MSKYAIERMVTHSVLQESRARGCLRQPQESRKPARAPFHFIVLARLSNRDGQRTNKDLTCDPRELLLALRARRADDRPIPRPCRCMEQRIPRRKEDARKLLVVVGHHRGAGCLLSHGEEVMNVLNRTEGLLPELKLDGGVELREARVEVVLERVTVGQVDRVWLVRVFGDVGEV